MFTSTIATQTQAGLPLESGEDRSKTNRVHVFAPMLELQGDDYAPVYYKDYIFRWAAGLRAEVGRVPVITWHYLLFDFRAVKLRQVQMLSWLA